MNDIIITKEEKQRLLAAIAQKNLSAMNEMYRMLEQRISAIIYGSESASDTFFQIVTEGCIELPYEEIFGAERCKQNLVLFVFGIENMCYSIIPYSGTKPDSSYEAESCYSEVVTLDSDHHAVPVNENMHLQDGDIVRIINDRAETEIYIEKFESSETDSYTVFE